MERTETKEVSQWVEVDATPLSPVDLASVKSSLDVTLDGDHVASFDAEQVEDIDENIELFAAIRTKINPRKQVKKHESQVGEHDKPKLKAVVLYYGIGKEVNMTQPVRFTAEDLVTVA